MLAEPSASMETPVPPRVISRIVAGDAQLEGNVGDHLGVSSAVSAVVAYCPTSDFLLSGGRNTLETQILPPPWAAALLGLDRIDDDPELARSASPRHRVHAGAPPHLILHGDRDAVFNHEESPSSTRRCRPSGRSRYMCSSRVPDMRARSSSARRSRRRSPASWQRSSVRTPLRHRPPGSSCSHPPNPLVHVARPRFGGCRRLCPGTGASGGSEGERHD